MLRTEVLYPMHDWIAGWATFTAIMVGAAIINLAMRGYYKNKWNRGQDG